MSLNDSATPDQNTEWDHPATQPDSSAASDTGMDGAGFTDHRIGDKPDRDHADLDSGVSTDRRAPDQGSSDAPAGGTSCADTTCDSGPVVTDCRNSLICSYPTPQCDLSTGLCVECLSDENCDDGLFCTTPSGLRQRRDLQHYHKPLQRSAPALR